MIKAKEDAIILRPEDLANTYGEYLLIIDGDEVAEGTELPETIYMRYEVAKELLFIDTRMFGWLELGDTLKKWRKTQQYCGPMVKRMASSTGRVINPRHVVVFDLSEKPEERTDPIRPRRGRPLKVEQERARSAVAAKAVENALSIHRRLSTLRETYRDHPLLSEVEDIVREAKRMLEEANRLATKGQKRGPKKGFKRKPHVPQEERIKLDALDGFLKDNIHAVHRILRRFVVTGGKQKLEDKDLRPRIPATDWIGRYEEVSNQDNGYTTKTLYVPVSVLKSMEELNTYEMDYRFVKKKYRRVGSVTAYCAVFDFGRNFIGQG